MTGREPWRCVDPVPATLSAARERLWRTPAADAPVTEWIAYHQHRAEVFEHVSKVDLRHRYEAWAEAWLAKDKIEQLAEANRPK